MGLEGRKRRGGWRWDPGAGAGAGAGVGAGSCGDWREKEQPKSLPAVYLHYLGREEAPETRQQGSCDK